MRVLMFLRTGDFSGAENVACQIITLLKDKIQFVYASPDGNICDILKEKRILHFRLKDNSYAEYKRAINSIKPDIVHAHDMYASFMSALTCSNIPLFIQIHNNAFNSRKINFKSLLFRYAANKAKKIIWVSESSFKGYAFHKNYTGKSEIIYNVIDTQEVAKKAKEVCANTASYDLVYVGRLTYQKNPHRLLGVVEKVVNKKRSTKVAIIGNGDLKGEILSLVQKKGLERNIDYLGFMKNPYPIIANSKVMLMTSRWEGMPMVCLEALSLGVPIISTPVDGVSHIVTHGENGFLSELDDNLSEYALKLVTDDALLKEMSEKASVSAKVLNDKIRYREKIFDGYKDCLKENNND